MSAPQITKSVHDAVHAAMREATDQAILPRFKTLTAKDVRHKAADDVVTVADHEAEAILFERLAAILPDAALIGEEAAAANPTNLDKLGSALCWIVDPLDGTNNFAAGKPPFGVLVALSDGGDTVAGWILDCQSGRFCRAVRGEGAWIDDEPVRARTSGREPPIASISLIFMDAGERETVRRHIAPYYSLVDIPRCAAEQYPRIVLGTNDVSVFNRTLPWDHAAGVLFLNEAGGRAARLDGSKYRVGDWDRPGLIGAASPRLWDDLAERIAAAGT